MTEIEANNHIRWLEDEKENAYKKVRSLKYVDANEALYYAGMATAFSSAILSARKYFFESERRTVKPSEVE